MQIIIKNEIYEVLVLSPWRVFEITKQSTNAKYRITLPGECTCPVEGAICKHLVALEDEAQKQILAGNAYRHVEAVAGAESSAWKALEEA